MNDELAGEQQENSYDKVPKQLRKYVFKKGQSGNPDGMKGKGKTMKQYSAEYLASMSEEDRLEFLNSIEHRTIWEMAEGKAKQDIAVEGEIDMLIKIDE